MIGKYFLTWLDVEQDLGREGARPADGRRDDGRLRLRPGRDRLEQGRGQVVDRRRVRPDLRLSQRRLSPSRPRPRRRPRVAPSPRARAASTERAASGPPTLSSSGSVRHRSHWYGQRGWNLQPGGIRNGLGTTPSIADRALPRLPSPGIEFSSPCVYGILGLSSTSSTVPVSTIRPAYITARFWTVSATTARSCVISSSAVPVRAWMSPISSRIWAWIVTSSAVVGSSAISSLGLHESAIAIMTRCRMPPDNSWGYWRTRRSGAERPTRRSDSIARLRASRLGHALMEPHGFRDLVADREHRVQAGHRLLEDHRDVVAADVAHLVLREREQVTPVEPDLPLDDLARRRLDEAHDRVRGDALAAAGLADQAQRCAALDPEVHPVDGPDDAVHHVEVRAQAAHLQEHVRILWWTDDRAGCLAPLVAAIRCEAGQYLLRGSRASRRPSPMKLIPSTVSTIARPGKSGHHQLPWGMNVSAFESALPQVGVVDVDAEAEEAHERLAHDHAGHGERRGDDDRAHGVGQDVAEDDPAAADAGRARGLDEDLVAQGQEQASARVARCRPSRRP